MNLMVDAMVYGYQAIFGSLGKVSALAGKDISAAALAKHRSDILIIRSRTKVNSALLNASTVKFVGSTVAGLDHIDLHYLKRRGIVFSQAVGANANAVAEYVISALVNLAAEQKFDLKEKTLAIIGVGHVGSCLYEKAKILGMSVLLNDPLRQAAENLAHFVDLEIALRADIISFHTPLSKTAPYPSYHLLNNKNAKLIKDSVIIINTARGGVIDENIWLQIKTSANVIDCWEGEPHINARLRQSAYWATPHIAGHSLDAKLAGSYMVYKDLCRFLGRKPDIKFKTYLKATKKHCKKPDLRAQLNCIYDFRADCPATRNAADFNHYRAHYPQRYEWHHYDFDLQALQNIKLHTLHR